MWGPETTLGADRDHAEDGGAAHHGQGMARSDVDSETGRVKPRHLDGSKEWFPATFGVLLNWDNLATYRKTPNHPH